MNIPTDRTGGRRPAPTKDTEDPEHRRAAQRIADIHYRWGVPQVLQMLADAVVLPDRNIGARALKERRHLLETRKALLEGSTRTVSNGEAKRQAGLSGSRSTWYR
jgi:hypothetical protein